MWCRSATSLSHSNRKARCYTIYIFRARNPSVRNLAKSLLLENRWRASSGCLSEEKTELFVVLNKKTCLVLTGSTGVIDVKVKGIRYGRSTLIKLLTQATVQSVILFISFQNSLELEVNLILIWPEISIFRIWKDCAIWLAISFYFLGPSPHIPF